MIPDTNVETLFGVPTVLSRGRTIRLNDYLTAIWRAQVEGVRKRPLSSDDPADLVQLKSDLEMMRHWFDPVASGRRLRKVVFEAPTTVDIEGFPFETDELLLRLPGHRALVTPEGRVMLWAIGRGLQDGPGDVYLSNRILTSAYRELHGLYKAWTQHRIRDVVGLLETETATLRPSVMGLLLVLLVNRNTSYDRRLPNPKDLLHADAVGRTLATPSLAFARALVGDSSDGAQDRGLELYRGWASGEISRRIGPGFHTSADGIWLDERGEEQARVRLLSAIAVRDASFRMRVADGLEAFLAAHERVRPTLAALGMAHDRPTNTQNLMQELRMAAALGEAP